MPNWRPAVGRVSRDVFLQYSIVVLVLLAVTATGLAAPLASRLAWFGLAWVLVAVAADTFGARRHALPDSSVPRWVVLCSVGVAFAVAYGLRALAQSHAAFPLGYDYGFYRAAMDHYANASHLGEAGIPHWIKDQFEPGVLYLHVALDRIAGIGSYDHLRWLFPCLSAGLVVPVYAAARDRFGPAAGLLAASFYVASFTQLTVHEYLYEKNVLGLAVWLAMVLCLRRRAWTATGVLLGATGFLHRPTFLLAVVTVAPGAVAGLLRRDARVLRLAAGLPFFLPLWLLRPQQYFSLALLQVQHASDNVGKAVPEGGGTFLNFTQYQNAAITYLPVALAGAVALWRRGERALSVALVACFANVALRLVFFNRFIIMLDLLAIVAAGVAYLLYLSAARPATRAVVLGGVLLAAGIPTVLQAAGPVDQRYVWLNAGQKEGLAWVRTELPANSTLLASNLDGPYVAGETGRRTYAPGLFDDPHTGAEWRLFFTERNETLVEHFVAAYPSPLYIVHATGHGPGLGTTKFVEPHFRLVHDEDGFRVWSHEASSG